MPYCSQCGVEVDNNTNFCQQCGAPIKKREKGAVVTPPVNLPPPKKFHGDARPINYRAENAEEPLAKHKTQTGDVPQGQGEANRPVGAPISTSGKTPEERMQERNASIKSWLVAGAIVASLMLVLPPIVLGYPLWEIFSEDGGGGSMNWDGIYYGDTVTVTPMGTTLGSGSFTVYSGYVSEGWFQGSVDSSGWFTGTIIISAGSPEMTVTGQFSWTETFTLYGSYGSSSWTCYAYKG